MGQHLLLRLQGYPLQEWRAGTARARAAWLFAAPDSAYAACVAFAGGVSELLDLRDYVGVAQGAFCSGDACAAGIGSNCASAVLAVLASVADVAAVG